MYRLLLLLTLVSFQLPALAAQASMAQPAYSDISGANTPPWSDGQPALRIAKKWDDLSAEEKRRVKEAEERYKKLPKDKKAKLRDKWENLPEKDRKKYKIERKYR